MIHIHFKAIFQPNRRKFLVTVDWGKKKLVERMSIAKFIRFARATDKPMVVGGTTIEIDEESDPAAEKQIRDYFLKVATAYMNHAGYGGKPENN